MTTLRKARLLRTPLALLAFGVLSGCATNFEPPPLSADHPASVQAQEAPRIGMRRLPGTDEITRKTNAQLARKEAPDSDFEGGGMSHDMGSMSGMDHSKMPGMSMPAPAPTGSPASKEAAEMEMKKTSDEMKKLSDEMKAKSDAEKSPKEPPSEAAYWTCVMHPEIHQDKPGQCPKCGMTLVRKEGVAK